jgi:hypothetical protein
MKNIFRKEPKIKLYEVDLKTCKLDVKIKDSNVEIVSNGDCRNTSIKVNGDEFHVKRLTWDMDCKDILGKLYFEVYSGMQIDKSKKESVK